jgi:hypothetical protein
MDRDTASRVVPLPSWRLDLLSFLALFSWFAAINAFSELQKMGHPIAYLLLRPLITAALIAGLLRLAREKWKRAG